MLIEINFPLDVIEDILCKFWESERGEVLITLRIFLTNYNRVYVRLPKREKTEQLPINC